MELPEIRRFGWVLKQLESAHTEVNLLSTGQTELIIKHDLIKGISTKMLSWWFEYFARLFVTLEGTKYPAYHLWHPNDHISVKIPNETLHQGDTLHINEWFQRNIKYQINDKTRVAYLNQNGIELHGYKMGICAIRLRHEFTDTDQGVQYNSRMLIGLEKGPLRRFVNSIVVRRKFSPDKAKAWLQHNVEEVGCFENFLKDLYDKKNEAPNIILD